MIVIAGSVAVRPERREEAVRVACTMATATRKEPGCVSYRFSADLDDPNYFGIEVYRVLSNESCKSTLLKR